MKTIGLMMFTLIFAATSFAQKANFRNDNVVTWKNIEGVVTALNVDNPVNNGNVNDPNTIHSGTFPWTTRRGNASVNLVTGFTSFSVDGLSISGSQFSGTPGPISAVVGTLVCDAGQPNQTAVDTDVVSLTAQGRAKFTGQLDGIPSQCTSPLFLIRIAGLPGANGLWIATGTERTIGDNGDIDQ